MEFLDSLSPYHSALLQTVNIEVKEARIRVSFTLWHCDNDNTTKKQSEYAEFAKGYDFDKAFAELEKIYH